MRLIKLVTLVSLALGLAYCGDKKKDSDNGPAETVAVSGISAEEAQQISSELSQLKDVMVRVPVIDGVEQYEQAELVSLDGPVKIENGEDAAALFENNENVQKPAVDGAAELDYVASTESWHGFPRRRGYLLPWRRKTANALYSLARKQRAQCCQQRQVYTPYAAYGHTVTHSHFSYRAWGSVANTWYTSPAYGQWQGGYNGGYGMYN